MFRHARLVLLSCVLLCGCVSTPATRAAPDTPAPAPQAEPGTLLLDVGNGWQALTPETLRGLPRSQVVIASGGNAGRWEGVALLALLQREQVPTGTAQHGAQLDRYVLAEAGDGYRVVFALGELDPAFGNREVLLADRRDGQPLAEGQGPLRLVVPGDGRGGRWVRDVRRIRVLKAAP